MTRESCSDSEAGLLLVPTTSATKFNFLEKFVLEFETTKLVFEKWAPTFASHVPDLANQYCALVLEFTIVKTKFVKINQPIFQEINWPFECFVFYDPSCHIFCIRQTQ